MSDMTESAIRGQATIAERSVTISRGLTATLFVAALLGFLLPFATVSCGTPVSFTGMQLATYDVPASTQDERDFADDVEGAGSSGALLALGAIAVGLGLAVLRKPGWGVAAVAGLLSLLFLPWIASFELADFRVHEGYVLSVGSLAVVATLRRVSSVDRRRAKGRRVWPAVLAGLALAAPLLLTIALCMSSGGSV